jgi:hypothetical protein
MVLEESVFFEVLPSEIGVLEREPTCDRVWVWVNIGGREESGTGEEMRLAGESALGCSLVA